MKLYSGVSVPRVVGARPTLSAADFPYDAPASDKLAFLLKYAVLAPSGHNTQPWRFEIHGPAVEVRGDFSRSLPVTDPDNRELVMSCGAALLNLRVAIRNFGYTSHTDLCPDSDDPALLARIELKGRAPSGRTDHKLFKAITDRRTTRIPFESKQIPRALLYRWQRAAAYEEAWLHVVESVETKCRIAELIAEGDRILGQSIAYRSEISRWVRPSDDVGRDGLPGYSLGMGALSSRVAPANTLPTGNIQATRDLNLVMNAPAFVVLGTEEDDHVAWMIAGQALARVLLAAQSEGVSASFFLQPVELTNLREKLMDLLPGESGYPQITFRLGYGPKVPPTPRRSLSEVLGVVETGDIAEGDAAFSEASETEHEYSD